MFTIFCLFERMYTHLRDWLLGQSVVFFHEWLAEENSLRMDGTFHIKGPYKRSNFFVIFIISNTLSLLPTPTITTFHKFVISFWFFLHTNPPTHTHIFPVKSGYCCPDVAGVSEKPHGWVCIQNLDASSADTSYFHYATQGKNTIILHSMTRNVKCTFYRPFCTWIVVYTIFFATCLCLPLLGYDFSFISLLSVILVYGSIIFFQHVNISHTKIMVGRWVNKWRNLRKILKVPRKKSS